MFSYAEFKGWIGDSAQNNCSLIFVKRQQLVWREDSELCSLWPATVHKSSEKHTQTDVNQNKLRFQLRNSAALL